MHKRAMYVPFPEETGGPNGGTGNDGGKNDGGATGSTWTPPASQQELDRVIQDRLARERSKFSDYDDLKAKAGRLTEIEKASQTELEKAIVKAKEEGRGEVAATFNARFVGAEARALAAEAKFRNPALAVRALDLSKIRVGDDGEVDIAGIKALLATLAKDEPYLVDDGKSGKPQPDNAQGAGKGTPNRADEGLEQARRRGFLPATQQ